MATQPPITTFFGSKKRRAVDDLERNSKLLKGDATLLKVTKIDGSMGVPEDISEKKSEKSEMCKKALEQTTPRKNKCDIRSYMTTKSPYRPECKSNTPVKFFRTEPQIINNETTPIKPASCLKNFQVPNRPPSAVKKSIRFEDDAPGPGETSVAFSHTPDVEDTDDIIKAANDLVEKVKNKTKSLSSGTKSNKPEPMTATTLKKKLARSAKLAELKSSLSKLGQHASELIKLEKKKKELEEPKITKFDAIEVEVPRSPHKGALASPMKSPAKPAYERFAHLVHRTGPSAVTSSLPLPLCYQRLLDLFIATDTVSSMMMNRGEIITFRKLKPAVQELTRKTLTERHLAQMAAVLPCAFEFRQEKMRNFGSTSKVDRYELVVTPVIEGLVPKGTSATSALPANLVSAADRKKMTPKMMQLRKDAFSRQLLERTIIKHEEFLADLDPPLSVSRGQLTRWHPNFPLDMVPDVPPVALPEPPEAGQAPTSAKDVLERAKQLLNGNERVRRALEITSTSMEELNKAGAKEETKTEPPTKSAIDKPTLDPEVKAAVDKRVAAHNPLKGISKSLLEKIRAKQLLATLNVIGSGNYQKDAGVNKFINVGQKSVSRYVREVVPLIVKAFASEVKFPMSPSERAATAKGFQEIGPFEGVLGAIDCTHIRISKPSENEWDFVNHKGYHSLNVQMICDSNLNFLYVESAFPGRVHDQFIWWGCLNYKEMERLQKAKIGDFYLLGDSGYALEKFLITPILNSIDHSAEDKYTKAHCSVRNTIERAFGALKARFRILHKSREVTYSPRLAAEIVNCCAILHNICLKYDVPEPTSFDIEEAHKTDNTTNFPREAKAEAIAHRQAIVNKYFR